ncbi:hypothetical protein [Dongshaea marina]|uniref:hypothetical protein n=1 Tax=Dongshaea marina TaxID=2047966 RepID=UPI000D3E88ED|nr:hypothetical protein [Dongshaea marina]
MIKGLFISALLLATSLLGTGIASAAVLTPAHSNCQNPAPFPPYNICLDKDKSSSSDYLQQILATLKFSDQENS